MPIYEPLSWMHVLWRPHTIIKMTRLHNPNAYVARGNDYFFTPKTFGGDKEKAVDTWKKAIALAPTSDAAETAHIWLARAYQSLGKNESATTEINEALKMNPERLFAKLVQGQPAAK
jgi:Tfp pilus assembly protein PilF